MSCSIHDKTLSALSSPYQTFAPHYGGRNEMLAIFLFCVLPILLLGIASVGVSIFSLGINEEIKDFENDEID